VPRKSVTFDRFLRAVHRRQVTLAIVERAALGLGFGCVVATVLVAVVLWRGGDDAWNLAGLVLAAGAVAGAVGGMVTRPSALAAASEADRQLGTADLLSTAFTLSGTELSDPWARTVLALAAERCRRHTPREVMLRRLGIRAWGGILLAVAFVAVLTALSSASRDAVASRTAGNDTTAPERDATRSAHQPIVELTDVTEPPATRQHRAQVSPEDQPPPGSNDASAELTSDSDGKRDARDLRTASNDASSPGVGGSQATSAIPRAPAAARPNPLERPDAHIDATAANHDGSPRAGVGPAARSNPNGTGPATGGVIARGDGNSGRRAAPWTSNSWPQTVESAEQELRAGRVPDDARDLVRGYFDPSVSPR
jgi:hypothetical protein